MRGKIFGHRQMQACFAQPLPVRPDEPEIFTGGQAGRQFFFHGIKRGGGFLSLGGAPVPHGLVAAEQRGRNSAVQLDGLHGLGNRLDQHEALQLLLRGTDDPLKADEQAVCHHGNRNHGQQPQQRKFFGVAKSVQQGDGRGEDFLHLFFPAVVHACSLF